MLLKLSIQKVKEEVYYLPEKMLFFLNVEGFLIVFIQLHTSFFFFFQFYNTLTLFYSYLRH